VLSLLEVDVTHVLGNVDLGCRYQDLDKETIKDTESEGHRGRAWVRESCRMLHASTVVLEGCVRSRIRWDGVECRRLARARSKQSSIGLECRFPSRTTGRSDGKPTSIRSSRQPCCFYCHSSSRWMDGWMDGWMDECLSMDGCNMFARCTSAVDNTPCKTISSNLLRSLPSSAGHLPGLPHFSHSHSPPENSLAAARSRIWPSASQ
jgi:hypothetical protein